MSHPTLSDPVPRDEAFRLYWHFAAERQSVFLKRLRAEPGPWTGDAILAQYKFCNVFRVSDRVTQDLLRQALYSNVAAALGPEDRVFRAIVYRFFSEPRTWAFLEETFGGVSLATFDERLLIEALDSRLAEGYTIYTGAFILCATQAYGHRRKHHNHAALFTEILSYNGSFLRKVLAAQSLQGIYDLLLQLPLIGKFMAYQLAIDINYGPDFDHSESSFVAAGPGAERGIKKCFQELAGHTPESTINWVVENQEDLARRYGYEAPTLLGRRLQSIDCQGLFCETDKYCRVALPELRSARTRIKATFKPNKESLGFFGPPKWGLPVYCVTTQATDNASKQGEFDLKYA